MADVVYTTVPGKISALLNKIRTVGIPAKVTNAWLKTIGFTSSNDGSLIGVLRLIGLIDASGVPTSRWNQYRGAKHKEILGDAIREGYADLFAVYPNAYEQSNIDLENVFSTSTKGGKQVISKIVSTFRGLSDQAVFNEQSAEHIEIGAGALHLPVADNPVSRNKAASSGSGPSLHIDLQIHISPDASTEQIDQIFASMSKHLYGRQ